MEKEQKVIEGFSDVTVDEQVQVEGGTLTAGGPGWPGAFIGMPGKGLTVGSGNGLKLTYE